jgi:hypothetical protein
MALQPTTLSWNDIRTNAVQFAAKFSKARNERSEAQTFWNAFFEVFGVARRSVAVYESQVKKLNKHTGFMDLFWPGMLLVEHKSRGEPLDSALSQAQGYFTQLKEGEKPRYIVACDFANFVLADLDLGTEERFSLDEFPEKVSLFGFIRGRHQATQRANDPVNDEAVRKLSRLHRSLRNDGYTGHDLQTLLVQLLFCLFADRTGIFEPAGKFADLLENHTSEDGHDTGWVVMELFDQLALDFDKRQRSLTGWFADFPYVNGHLFSERCRVPAFNAEMRALLIDCCHTDWSRISPAIFGSMFQHIIDAEGKDARSDLRRELGAHYTSEENILKLIGPLFLDALKAEFSKVKSSKNALFEFQKKLSKLRFLDPACGCGNFLVITYRELRLLELEVLKAALKFGHRVANPFEALLVDVDQFNGIELEEFPARVAQVAMWLTDHQMNMQASHVVKHWVSRLPLAKTANIRMGNALAIDWVEFCPPERLNYILGNPPFVGKQFQTEAQKADLERVFAGTGIADSGVLDYVAAWYVRAAQYLTGAVSAKASDRKKEFTDAQFTNAKTADIFEEPAAKKGKKGALQEANDIFELQERLNREAREKIGVAFVSTNSICQGEQVGALWGWMLAQGVAIEFAHRTFKWSNEATGKAAVHCVIVGFGLKERVARANKAIYHYEDPAGEPAAEPAARINPYLVDAPDVALPNRKAPICDVSPIVFGSMPNDGGFLLLNETERAELLAIEPEAKPWVRAFLGAEEFINGTKRYCLWLKDCPPGTLAKLPVVKKRVAAVKRHRMDSTREATQRLAVTPTLFGEDRQPESRYLLVPGVSSERRAYIPIGFLTPKTVASNATLVVPKASVYEFGILTSAMHNAWMRYVCGRLKSDYRYSAGIVYNNFPWPDLASMPDSKAAQGREAVELAAQAVLDARESHGKTSLAVLYDPDTMPPDLLKCHEALDRAVDLAYGVRIKRGQDADSGRVSHLFSQYKQLASSVDKAAET